MPDDLEAWHRELRTLLDAVADAMRALGIARGAAGMSDAVHAVAAERGEDGFESIVRRVKRINLLAARVGEPTLSVPGAAPEVDLRPWWSRLLQRASATAQRTAIAESLETLRLEADAALVRAAARLAT